MLEISLYILHVVDFLFGGGQVVTMIFLIIVHVTTFPPPSPWETSNPELFENNEFDVAHETYGRVNHILKFIHSFYFF